MFVNVFATPLGIHTSFSTNINNYFFYILLLVKVECATYINSLVSFDLKTSFTINVDLCALRFLSSLS